MTRQCAGARDVCVSIQRYYNWGCEQQPQEPSGFNSFWFQLFRKLSLVSPFLLREISKDIAPLLKKSFGHWKTLFQWPKLFLSNGEISSEISRNKNGDTREKNICQYEGSLWKYGAICIGNPYQMWKFWRKQMNRNQILLNREGVARQSYYVPQCPLDLPESWKYIS